MCKALEQCLVHSKCQVTLPFYWDVEMDVGKRNERGFEWILPHAHVSQTNLAIRVWNTSCYFRNLCLRTFCPPAWKLQVWIKFYHPSKITAGLVSPGSPPHCPPLWSLSFLCNIYVLINTNTNWISKFNQYLPDSHSVLSIVLIPVFISSSSIPLNDIMR